MCIRRCFMAAGYRKGWPRTRRYRSIYPLLGEFNPRGTIRLHVSRFLHLTLALRFQSARAAGDRLNPVGGGLEEISLPPRYDLHVQRLMRSGELHFFDHPAFGVIVVVRPQPEEPETLEEDLTPAA